MEKWQELVTAKFKDWPVKPSPPDERDWPLRAIVKPVSVPDAASLKHYNTGILNQYQSPLCAAYSIVSILHAYYNLPPGTLSPRFVYWQAKLIDGIPDQEGTTLRAVLQVAHKIGACPERLCPSWPDWSKPVFTPEMIAEAARYKIRAYARLQVGTLTDIEQAIASGRMVIIGSLVTRGDWADGWILAPEGQWGGGHATVLLEYDRNLTYNKYKRFVGGPNSWGTSWGMDGFYQMAQSFAEWKCDDLDGMPSLYEAWAVEFERPFVPRIPEQVKTFDVAPMLMPIEGGDRTMVELRGVASVTGATDIRWDSVAKTVTLEYPDRVVTLQIGKKEYQVVLK